MNRVHHVSWCFEPENLEAAKTLWERQLGVPLLDFVLESDGLRVLLAWDQGVELISPHGQPGPAGSMVRDHLDRCGEGVYAVVLFTDDFTSVVDGLGKAGATVVHPEEAVLEGVPLPTRPSDAGPPSEDELGFEMTGGMFSEILGMRLAFQQFRLIER